jgi:tetratricopeptide (TPR) repeat protein
MSAPGDAVKVPDAPWEVRLAALWSELDLVPADVFVARMDSLAVELGPSHPIAAFERACAFDSTGQPDAAAVHYQRALDDGLAGYRRRRATIQLASSLRNLGQLERAERLLAPELDAEPDELSSAVRGFLALIWADLGREREALSLSLQALAGHLPRYNRSLDRYARALLDDPSLAAH